MVKKSASDVMRLFLCNGLAQNDLERAKVAAMAISFGLTRSFEMMAEKAEHVVISYDSLFDLLGHPWKELLFDDPSLPGKDTPKYAIPLNPRKVPWPPRLNI